MYQLPGKYWIIAIKRELIIVPDCVDGAEGFTQKEKLKPGMQDTELQNNIVSVERLQNGVVLRQRGAIQLGFDGCGQKSNWSSKAKLCGCLQASFGIGAVYKLDDALILRRYQRWFLFNRSIRGQWEQVVQLFAFYLLRISNVFLSC